MVSPSTIFQWKILASPKMKKWALNKKQIEKAKGLVSFLLYMFNYVYFWPQIDHYWAMVLNLSSSAWILFQTLIYKVTSQSESEKLCSSAYEKVISSCS